MFNFNSGDIEKLQTYADRFIDQKIPRDIARLYSQYTRIRAQGVGLPSWTEEERTLRFREAEKLLIAGLASSDTSKKQLYLRRAGEIFEWAATGISEESLPPAILLASSAYQLAGYYARATGLLSESNLPEETSKILAAFLSADFPKAQTLLLHYWEEKFTQNESDTKTEHQISTLYLEQILRAMGIVTAWLRWGDESRIERAIHTLELSAKALRHDEDNYSWILSVLFSNISKNYKNDSLWTTISEIESSVSGIGEIAFNNYLKEAFISRKILTWPSQRSGIDAISTNSSFALCTPTGSGKTRVAEIAILKYLFPQNIDDNVTPIVLYVAPSRALCAEVESTLSNSLGKIKTAITVTALYGGTDFGATDIANYGENPTVLICTQEKADALIRFYGADIFKNITCVIIDEAHGVEFSGKYEELAQAGSRSLRLEFLVDRLKTFCSDDTKYIALSAVAAEVKEQLASWITSKSDSLAITTDYRSTRQLFGKLLCGLDGKTRIEYDILDGQSFSLSDEHDSPYVRDPFPIYPGTGDIIKSIESFGIKSRVHLLWAAIHFARKIGYKGHRSVLISVASHPEYYAKTFLELLDGPWGDQKLPSYFSRPVEGENADFLCDA